MTPSPCVKQCKLANPIVGDNFCLSCKRTAEEISAWRTLPDSERIAIMTALPSR